MQKVSKNEVLRWSSVVLCSISALFWFLNVIKFNIKNRDFSEYWFALLSAFIVLIGSVLQIIYFVKYVNKNTGNLLLCSGIFALSFHSLANGYNYLFSFVLYRAFSVNSVNLIGGFSPFRIFKTEISIGILLVLLAICMFFIGMCYMKNKFSKPCIIFVEIYMVLMIALSIVYLCSSYKISIITNLVYLPTIFYMFIDYNQKTAE